MRLQLRIPLIWQLLLSACYRAIERDYNLDQRVVRDTIRVTGLVKCEEACTDTRLFTCRSFAFSTSLSSSFNCYLSDRSGAQLTSDFVRDFDSIVYEKEQYCDNDRGLRWSAQGSSTYWCVSRAYILIQKLFNIDWCCMQASGQHAAGFPILLLWPFFQLTLSFILDAIFLLCNQPFRCPLIVQQIFIRIKLYAESCFCTIWEDYISLIPSRTF